MEKILYFYPAYISFVRNDETLLQRHFRVHSFHFSQEKSRIAFSFIRQFFFLLFQRKTAAYVSFFAGYSSFLPALFARLMRKPHLIILGGTDCSSFPSIRYGNFQKKLLGWCTCMSLRWATHLLPVDETLIDTPYSYTLDDFPRQGFRNFCSKVTAKIETIHIGFDPDKFYRSAEKAGNTFLTVAQMNPANFYRKGIDLIFSIAPSFPHCTFTIVGNSPGMKYPSVPANVRMLPFVKYEDLIHLYSEHEFYLQLSIMEGFPSAPCEAMLCECIPVTSGVGALPSIVGETGFILRNKSQPELIRLVETALASDRQLLGRKARQQIMDHFPADTRMRLVQLIREIIDHGRALR